MRFMLLQNYGGVPEGTAPMSEWAPAEIEAHIEAQHLINDELKERGEFVDAQALTSPEQAKFVVSGGGSPVVTDGPSPSPRSCSPTTGRSTRPAFPVSGTGNAGLAKRLGMSY